MKWYGFLIIFFAVSVFDNLLQNMRLDYTSSTSLVKTEMRLPQEPLPIFLKQDVVFSEQRLPSEPVLLFYFGSWCRACLMSFPLIVELSERHDISFFGIAINDKEENLKALLSKFGNPFTEIGFDEQMAWAQQMNATAVPTIFILDKNKQAVARIKGILTKDFYFNTLLPYIEALKKEEPNQ